MQTLTPRQLNETLTRLGLGAEFVASAPTDEMLKIIYSRFIYTIPYHNMLIYQQGMRPNWQRQCVPLDVETLFQQLIVDAEGGCCYQIVEFFYHLLTALGFDVKRIQGQLYHRGHLDTTTLGLVEALIVDIDNALWLLDPGFGCKRPRLPIRIDLQGESIAEQSFETFKIQRVGEGFCLALLRKRAWDNLYYFTLDEIDFAKVSRMNHTLIYYPGNIPVRDDYLLFAMVDEASRSFISTRDQCMWITQTATHHKRRVFRSHHEALSVIKTHFKLTVSEAMTALFTDKRARIPRRHSAVDVKQVCLSQMMACQPNPANSVLHRYTLFRATPANTAIVASQQPRPIIFLDIDGVLYDPNKCRADYVAYALWDVKAAIKQLVADNKISMRVASRINTHNFRKVMNFSTKAIANIRQLCVEMGARIVISSTWRTKLSFDLLCAIFAYHNLHTFIIDVTPSVGHYCREREVMQWLQLNHSKVSNFVIIDDIAFQFKNYFGDHFVHCGPEPLFIKPSQMAKAWLALHKPKLPTLKPDRVMAYYFITVIDEQRALCLDLNNLVKVVWSTGWSLDDVFAQFIELNRTINHVMLKGFQSRARDLLRYMFFTTILNGDLQQLTFAESNCQLFDYILSRIEQEALAISTICFRDKASFSSWTFNVSLLMNYSRPLLIHLDFEDNGEYLERIHAATAANHRLAFKLKNADIISADERQHANVSLAIR